MTLAPGEDMSDCGMCITGHSLGTVSCGHVGAAVLIAQQETKSNGSSSMDQAPILWIEGASDDSLCPT